MTLIELLVVIAIIAILIGLLFPAFKAVQNQARQAQAKNDLTQIVNAVNAYYTEYGRYPISGTAEVTIGPGGSPSTDNEILLRELRGCPNPVTGHVQILRPSTHAKLFSSRHPMSKTLRAHVLASGSRLPIKDSISIHGEQITSFASMVTTTIKLQILMPLTLVREPEHSIRA